MTKTKLLTSQEINCFTPQQKQKSSTREGRPRRNYIFYVYALANNIWKTHPTIKPKYKLKNVHTKQMSRGKHYIHYTHADKQNTIFQNYKSYILVGNLFLNS